MIKLIESKKAEIRIAERTLHYIDVESIKEYRTLKKISISLVTKKNKELFIAKEIRIETRKLEEIDNRRKSYNLEFNPEAIKLNKINSLQQQDFILGLKGKVQKVKEEVKDTLVLKERIDLDIKVRSKLRKEKTNEIYDLENQIKQIEETKQKLHDCARN